MARGTKKTSLNLFPGNKNTSEETSSTQEASVEDAKPETAATKEVVTDSFKQENKEEDAYAELYQPKRPPVKMTFDIDPDLAEEFKEFCLRKRFGFKKIFANEAIRREMARLKSKL